VDFDALFIPDAPSKTGLIIPQLAFYDVKNIYLLGTNLWHARDLIELSRPFVQGAIIPEGFFPESASEEVHAFSAAFETAYGEQPGFIEAIAYDSARMLLEIVGRSENMPRSGIRNALSRLTEFRGVTGLTSFLPDGEARKRLYLLTVRGDGFVELNPGR
jgi:ABC-type branched-subunit amino acid transport system substrate-binding protein